MTAHTTPDAQTTQVFRIYINAPAEKVWAGLTSSEFTTRYGYAGPVDIDMRPGGRFLHWFGEPQRDDQGNPLNAISGEILECDEPRRLVLTWSAFWIDEPATTITYDIEDAAEGGVRLTLTQEGPSSPQTMMQTSGNAPANQSGAGGWPWVLSALKSLLETGTEVIRPA